MPKFLFFDYNPYVADAYAKEFTSLENCSVLCEDVRKIEADYYVSPANSYGFYDGGIDAVYAEMWPTIQDVVQDRIRQQLTPYIEVGDLKLVKIPDTNSELIVLPTMRTPGTDISMTVNVYTAAVRLFVFMDSVATFGNSEALVAIPGLGTSAGRIRPEICARQVKAAYDEIVLGHRRVFDSWMNAKQYELWLIGR